MADSDTKSGGKRGPGRPPKKAPDFDFSTLEFAEAEKPKPQKEDNPFVKPLGESYEYERARQTRVPKDVAPRVETLLRRAANELSIGVSIAPSEPDAEGMVTVVFIGKERRKRKSKTETPETPAAPAESTAEDVPAGDVPAGQEGDAEGSAGDAPEGDATGAVA
jgi:hypothetical protein